MVEQRLIRAGQPDKLAIGLLTLGLCSSELYVIRVLVDKVILFPVGVVGITGPQVSRELIYDSCAERISLDVTPGLQKVTLSTHQRTLVTTLPEVSHIMDALLVPPPVPLEDRLHELREQLSLCDFEEEMNMVRHQTVVIEHCRVAFLRSKHTIEKVTKGFRFMKDGSPIVTTGNEVVAAMIGQLARFARHGYLADTIRDASGRHGYTEVMREVTISCAGSRRPLGDTPPIPPARLPSWFPASSS